MIAPKLKEDFEGRIRNLSLSPSKPGNSLVPLFEAIANSMHAIQLRFREHAIEHGRIMVLIEPDENGSTCSMTISDNGIGLDDDQFDAFLTVDTSAKVRTGGKGVGRLTWLKVFEQAVVFSRFQTPSGTKRRSFTFVPDRNQPLQNYRLDKTTEPLGTEVRLDRMRADYWSHCPSKLETIAKKVIAHFFPALFSSQMPFVSISMGDDKVVLTELLHEKIHRTQHSVFDFFGTQVQIEHSLIDRAITDHFDQHTLLFSANQRIVEEHELDNQIGIATYIQYEGQPTRYIGIVTSDLLDANVSQERNRFDIDTSTFDGFRGACVDSVKSYLSREIEAVINRQKEKLELVVCNFPRFSYLVDDKDEFVRQRLPLNANNEEAIFRQLSVMDYRASRDVVATLAAATGDKTFDVLAKVDAQSRDVVLRIQQQERAALLEYVAKRKLVLDLLSKYQGYDQEEERLNYLEAAVHRIICPTQVTSQDVDIQNHNLWVIDDRLTFYDFWASDKEIRNFVSDSESQDRPDIILFKGSALFHRPGLAQPVVIVEFKRPARRNYPEEEDPIRQIYSYIRELRGKSVRDKLGALITSIDNQTPFFCYLVADITNKLEQHLMDQQISKPIPGGRGFFGYHPDYNAYIEVIQYSKLIDDARLRNEVFFKKLGIN